MLCPKCGREGEDGREECPACGVLYIKWMIKRRREESPPVRGNSSGTRLKRTLWPAAAAAAAVLAATTTMTPPAPPMETEDYPALTADAEVLRKGTSVILEEARTELKPYGLYATSADFAGYFAQGLNSFKLEHLREVELAAGRVRPSRPSEPEERDGRETRPYKCTVGGGWLYFDEPPGLETAQSCWSAERTLKRKSIWDNPYEDVVWLALTWAPKKGHWAFYTRAEDAGLFRRHIASAYGQAAQHEDKDEALREARQAGKNKGRLKSALLTAYRSRARRAGALHRLGLLPR